MSFESCCLLLTTFSEESQAKVCAQKLLEKRWVACANILPKMTSLYVWQGKIEESEEVQLVLKTTKKKVDDIKAWIHENHSYDLPEVIVVPMIDGEQTYLSWIVDSVKD